MDIRTEQHTTFLVTLTDEEAKDVIADPSDFVSKLQDSLGVRTITPARKSARSTRRKLDTIHCDKCGRDIVRWRFAGHVKAKHMDES